MKQLNAAYGSTRLAQDPPGAGDLTSTAELMSCMLLTSMNWLDVSLLVLLVVCNPSGDNGLTASGTTDVTVSGVDATTAVKGVVQLTDTVATNSTLAVTGTAVEGLCSSSEHQ